MERKKKKNQQFSTILKKRKNQARKNYFLWLNSIDWLMCFTFCYNFYFINNLISISLVHSFNGSHLTSDNLNVWQLMFWADTSDLPVIFSEILIIEIRAKRLSISYWTRKESEAHFYTTKLTNFMFSNALLLSHEKRLTKEWQSFSRDKQKKIHFEKTFISSCKRKEKKKTETKYPNVK